MKLVWIDKYILVADRVDRHGILSRVGWLFPDRTHSNVRVEVRSALSQIRKFGFFKKEFSDVKKVLQTTHPRWKF